METVIAATASVRGWSGCRRAATTSLVLALTTSLAPLCLADPPPYDIPQELASRMLRGHRVRMVILGDSISNSTFGNFYEDGTDRNHFPPQNGMHNVWTPAEGWYGLYVPPPGGVPSSGGYSNWHGVGAFIRNYDEGWTVGPRVSYSDYPDQNYGWTIDTVARWRFDGAPQQRTQLRLTSYLYTPRSGPGELNHGSLASEAIGRGNLHVRHIVYTAPGITTVPKITFVRTGDTSITMDYPPAGDAPRWVGLDYPAVSPQSIWNRDLQRYETASSMDYNYDWQPEHLTHYITAGTLFYDANSTGTLILSIAQGGDNNLDHLRTRETYGHAGYFAYRDRGFSDAGLLSWLDANDMTTSPDTTPVVMITLGTNPANPDNGGEYESVGGLTTQAYADNIKRIIARYRAVYAQRGLNPYFILLAMYDWGVGYPNPFIESRAQRLYDVKLSDPQPDRIGFVSLPATMGYAGTTFQTSWYYKPWDCHLSSAGSVRVAQILWDAFKDSACPADFNTDGILNNSDFFAYLTAYATNDPRADLTTTSIPGTPGYGVPNTLLTSDDFFYYLARFVEGC